MAGNAGADPASHRRSVAPRRRTSMLAPSLATSGTTADRFTVSRSNSANGRGELSLGRPADPPRIADTRHRHFRMYCLAPSARPPDDKVTNLADCLANHRGGQTCISPPVTFAHAHDDDTVVDASDWSFRRALSVGASRASFHGPCLDWVRSRQPSLLGVRLGQHHLQDQTGPRSHQPRGPPRRSLFMPSTLPLGPTAV